MSGNHEVAFDYIDESMNVTERSLYNILINFNEGKFSKVIELTSELDPKNLNSFQKSISNIFKIRSEMYVEEKEIKLSQLKDLKNYIQNFVEEKSKAIALYFLYTSVLESFMIQTQFQDAMAILSIIEDLLKNLSELYNYHFLLLKGQLLNYMGEFEKALLILNNCKSKFLSYEDLFSLSKIYYFIGTIHGKRGDFRKAKHFFYKVIELSSDISNDYELVRTFIGLSIVTNFQGNHQEAYNYIEYALNLAKNNRYYRLEKKSISNRAGILFREGRYLEAIQDYTELLDYYVIINNLSQIKYLLNCLGTTYSRLGNLEVALEYYEQVLEIKDHSGSEIKNIQLLINVADIYIQTGRYDDAKLRLQKAQELNKSTKSKQFDAHILLEYGTLNFQCGNYKEALDDLNTSMDLYYKMENIMMYSSAKYHLAKLHRRLGNYQQSLRNLKQCESLNESSGNYDEKSRILLLYFIIYTEIFRFDKAKKIVEKLKELKFKISNKSILKSIELSEALLNQFLEGKTSKKEIEKTYRFILSKKGIDQEYYMFTLIQFIEFLLSEIFVNDDNKIIIEIEKYLYQLYELMTQLSSPYMRCQTLILQYKISLARGDMFSAELYLNEAHEVAAEYGFSGKLTEISIENLKLTQQLSSM